mgnify:CR=1 FL=1
MNVIATYFLAMLLAYAALGVALLLADALLQGIRSVRRGR